MSLFDFFHHNARQRHLRGFDEVSRHVGALQRRMPKLETVDTLCIVGSVGRAHELDASFRPVRKRGRDKDNERFRDIRNAMRRGRALPAVQLYRLGREYFVLDGHHRVAAALELGQLALDAHVIEFVTGEYIPTRG